MISMVEHSQDPALLLLPEVQTNFNFWIKSNIQIYSHFENNRFLITAAQLYMENPDFK